MSAAKTGGKRVSAGQASYARVPVTKPPPSAKARAQQILEKSAIQFVNAMHEEPAAQVAVKRQRLCLAAVEYTLAWLPTLIGALGTNLLFGKKGN